MIVNLGPDECSIYSFWKEYLPPETQLSILDLTAIRSREDYYRIMNPTARNRYRYASKKYSTFVTHRNNLLSEIHEINTSARVRQNKPMRDHYLAFPEPTSPETCLDHYTVFLGCFSHAEHKLVAYCMLQFCGELSAITQILGHAEYLRDDIMLNLFEAAVNRALEAKSKCMVYSRWTDGTDGLRHWKYSVGFKPGTIQVLEV